MIRAGVEAKRLPALVMGGFLFICLHSSSKGREFFSFGCIRLCVHKRINPFKRKSHDFSGVGHHLFLIGFQKSVLKSCASRPGRSSTGAEHTFLNSHMEQEDLSMGHLSTSAYFSARSMTSMIVS